MSKGPAAGRDRRAVLALIGGFFLLSGGAGLVYEVIWFRLLLLKLGGTGLAIATVTATFMAGLGLGAWLFGTRWARNTPPILLYALLEAATGLYALLVPALVLLVGQLDTVIFGDGSGTTIRLLRFLMAGAVLLPPTICMGGTLPALARLVEGTSGRPGRFIGILYGLNTTGAVLGAGAAGFIFLPTLGFSATVKLAALVNLLLAGLAFVVSRRFETGGSNALPRPAQPPRGPGPIIPPRARLAFFAYTSSGAIAFMLQVTWARILSMVFASSVYAFSIILVIFLAGLGLGALLAAPLLDRMGSPRRALAWCFLVAGGTALLGQGLYERIPALYLQAIMRTESGLPLLPAAALAALIMLPATLALGAGFPMAVRVATGDAGRGASARVGRLYAGNTAGSVLGAFATALVLIPWLGLPGVVSLASFLALGIAVAVALSPSQRARQGDRLRGWPVVVTALAVVLAWVLVVPGWNASLMSESVAFWRPKIAAVGVENTWKLFDSHRRSEAAQLLYYRDGVTATVTVKEQTSEGLLPNRYMTVDGKVDATSKPDRLQQVLLAHLPLLLRRPEGTDILVIGYASGMTVGSVLTHPVRTVVAAEIEEVVLEASALFSDLNHNALGDPRLEMVADDARAYMERTTRSFDIITSSPSSAWLSGPSKLFTLEFFELARRRLNPGGLVCQFIQAYDLDEESVWVLLRTLRAAFPHAVVFNADRAIFLVVASNEPIAFDLDILASAWERPQVRADLAASGVRGPLGLVDYFVADVAGLDAALPPGPLNTDDNALVEYRGPGSTGLSVHHEIVAALERHSTGSAAAIAGLQPQGSIDPGPLAQAALQQGAHRAARSLARQKLSLGADVSSLWVVGELLRQDHRRPQALESFAQALAIDPAHPLTLISMAMSLQELGRTDDALVALETARTTLGETPLVLCYRGLARLDRGDPEAALADLDRAGREARGRALPVPIEPYLARALDELGRPAEGRVYLEAFLARQPGGAQDTIESTAARERLATILTRSGTAPARATELSERAAKARLPIATRILEGSDHRLTREGTIAARHYLESLAALDPALAPALRQALSTNSRFTADLQTLVNEILPAP